MTGLITALGTVGAAGLGAATSGKGGGSTSTQPTLPPWLASLLQGGARSAESLFERQQSNPAILSAEDKARIEEFNTQIAGLKGQFGRNKPGSRRVQRLRNQIAVIKKQRDKIANRKSPFNQLEQQGRQDILEQLGPVRGDIGEFAKLPDIFKDLLGRSQGIGSQIGGLSEQLGGLAPKIEGVADTFGSNLGRFLNEDPNDPVNAAFRESVLAPGRREFLETVLPRLGTNEALTGNIGSSKGTLEEIGAGERYLRQVGDLSARVNESFKDRSLQAIGLLPQQAGILGQAGNVRGLQGDLLGLQSNILGQQGGITSNIGNVLQQLIGLRTVPGQLQQGLGQQTFERRNTILDDFLRRITGISGPFAGQETTSSGGGNPFAGALGGGILGGTLIDELLQNFGGGGAGSRARTVTGTGVTGFANPLAPINIARL